MRRTHLLAPALVATLLIAATGRGPARATRLASAVYLLALLVGAARTGTGEDRLDGAALPLVWAIMHLAWGGGFLAGGARMGVPLSAVRSCLRPRRSGG